MRWISRKQENGYSLILFPGTQRYLWFVEHEEDREQVGVWEASIRLQNWEWALNER